MKRSEALQHVKARTAWGTKYTCVSTVSDEEYFSHSGCDICSDLPCGGAGSVVDVRYLLADDVVNGVRDGIYEGELCGACLCSVVNGDDSDLDFSVTEEDVP